MPKLDVRHLLLVQAIAEEGSLTRAGLRLNLTQSALSHQLRDAEERLGVRLFDRIGRRLRLAPAGERLLRSARTVLEELGRAEAEVGRLGAGARSVIRLTTQCNTVYHWLPPLLRRFQKPYPEVDLELVAGATDDPIPALLAGVIDLAIVHRPVRDARIRLRPLFRDEMVVVMPPKHRLSRAPFVAAPDLKPEHLILYSIPREANLVFRDVLIPAGVSPKRVTHIQLTEAIVELVKAGLGLSVLARWSVAPQLERGELVARPLTRAGRFRHWSAAYRSRDVPAALLGFVELLARHPLPLGTTPRERRHIADALAGTQTARTRRAVGREERLRHHQSGGSAQPRKGSGSSQ